MMKVCQHHNIIKLFDVFENADYLYIVMEYVKGSDMFDYLEKREFKIPELRAQDMAKSIALAIKYFHELGIIHRDIKLENILMSDNQDTASPKLSDFGLSAMIGPG